MWSLHLPVEDKAKMSLNVSSSHSVLVSFDPLSCDPEHTVLRVSIPTNRISFLDAIFNLS